MRTPFLIVSLHPHATHFEEVAQHPLVHGLRFNTIVPTTLSPRDVLQKLRDACKDKPLFVDIKGRQLRVLEYTDALYAAVRVSHRIQVETPATVFFKDYQHPGCMMEATITEVEGDRLILTRRPCRPLGKGEALNILDPSLMIEEYLTSQDRVYLEAACELGINSVMASFFEKWSDQQDILAIHPKAHVMAKIESTRGMDFVRKLRGAKQRISLMAALDDLYINRGPCILQDLAAIRRYDPSAVAASRILISLEQARDASDVSFQDLLTVMGLWKMGYGIFILSDGLCYDAETFRMAMQVWKQVTRDITQLEKRP
ncbi:TPA: hypothetical protein DEP34_04965 [Candidatus Uhrbacteria bacterium]|uniref:Pyruvate kinase barrel domain-containing protein n=2 Tax=Candidatus Uhriibacteriota TaxID=1752732 RepID=A0A0G1SF78_9BACT|nr:MAG: hypothetical protein UX45_C0013G0003 [Candidatus Uhrbacteria bacterium GW2011_GWF2_46_218]KKU40723.1 MAG: hypothetical protein UX57_C0011G0009 [Candidatus Uhrbacteria bacterium GW2011_GWE2_46_68]HBK33594.1 hypothetical protein [Candidatus Uhrbacteria bacterium]HCB19691.1 hypothetical protein [Candidatus Uhrbacteria bacterium]